LDVICSSLYSFHAHLQPSYNINELIVFLNLRKFKKDKRNMLA
jgi:hypothetical protein